MSRNEQSLVKGAAVVIFGAFVWTSQELCICPLFA